MSRVGGVVIKGRQPKLPLSVVVASRKAVAARRATVAQLAERYGVSKVTLAAAVRGTTWKHLKKPPPVRVQARVRRRPLTPELVAEARRAVEDRTKSITALAQENNVSRWSLAKAVRGETWTHLKEPPPVPELPYAPKRPSRPSRELVIEARRLAAKEGMASLKALAAQHDVSLLSLKRASRGDSWKHLKDPPPVTGRRTRR